MDVEIPVLVMPLVDVDALVEEDKRLDMENIQRPFRFGYAIDVDIDIKKEGVKKELPDGGTLWLLKIHCSDAYTINLIYNRFWLAKGSKFFVYNEDKSMVLGAFTPENSNNSYNEYATDLVLGDTVILEYYEPELSDDGVINISKVIHGYINTLKSNGLGTSGGCNVDVMCPLGNNWILERRAVTMLLVDNNTAFCFGCLVNNTAQDSRPYILTANHCYYNASGNQISTPATNIYRFLYWRPYCGSGTPSNWQSITGATMRAHFAGSDFALLELNTRPSASLNLHYAGWDRRNVTPFSTIGIHHPRGDAMKISSDFDPPVQINYNAGNGAADCWRVVWNMGTTEQGSSGSPLFNEYSHHVVGQLYGGIASCQNTTGHDNYGRFDISWDRAGSSSANRLRDWLDPLGVAPNTLNGIGGATIYGPDVIGASCSATYTIGLPSSGVTGQTWQVIGGGVTPTSGTGPSFTVSRTANLNDPINTTIQCTFIYNGLAYTTTKPIVARIEPVYGWMSPAPGPQYSYYLIANIPLDQRLLVLDYEWEVTPN